MISPVAVISLWPILPPLTLHTFFSLALSACSSLPAFAAWRFNCFAVN